MLIEFIDFVKNIFPGLVPEIGDQAKLAIEQFQKDGDQPKYLTRELLSNLSQGDIISNIPFSFFANNGEQQVSILDAMVISTSCDIDNKGNIILAPIIPEQSLKEQSIKSMKANIVYDYMYLPDDFMSNSFVYFGMLSSYNRYLIAEGIKKGKIQRKASLNQLGYYFLIVKLSVFLLRGEDTETLNERGFSVAS